MHWNTQERARLHATGVSTYTITARRDYMESDYQEGVAFLVRMVMDFDVYDGQTLTKGRLIKIVTVGVVPGHGGHQWQMAAWSYDGGGWQHRELGQVGMSRPVLARWLPAPSVNSENLQILVES